MPEVDMDRGIERIAEAFSRHRFAEAYPHLLDDVRWRIVGDRQVVGRADVVSTCEQSAEYLAGVTTTFSKFRLLAGTDSVVVDSEAAYVDQDGQSSTVASCDIFDFSDGRLSTITSYTIELADPAT
jgi:SnoaL-like domain